MKSHKKTPFSQSQKIRVKITQNKNRISKKSNELVHSELYTKISSNLFLTSSRPVTQIIITHNYHLFIDSLSTHQSHLERKSFSIHE